MGGPPVLLGELGPHARSRTLSLVLGAEAGKLPEMGVTLAFAREFQEKADQSSLWLQWCSSPGRLLVLLPPFTRGRCICPVPWEARYSEPVAGGDSELATLLARERQYELHGELLPLERSGGQLLTGGWRRHPAAGLLLVTTLPLWSLVLLEHREVCRSWLTGYLEQAGSHRPEPPQEPLTRSEWCMMVHLYTHPFVNETEAIQALHKSSIFNIEPETAAQALKRTDQHGLSVQGKLTPLGEEVLLNSHYAAYARELKRMHHV